MTERCATETPHEVAALRNEIATLSVTMGNLAGEKAGLEEQLRAAHASHHESMERLAADNAKLEAKLQKERAKFKKALGEAEAYFNKVREHMLVQQQQQQQQRPNVGM